MPKTEKNMAILKDSKGGDVALKGVKIRGRLHGLMAEVEVEQSYANPQKTNIEAIYTFPLPLGATLLGLEVEIAGKKLTGRVSVSRRKLHAPQITHHSAGLRLLSVRRMECCQERLVRIRPRLPMTSVEKVSARASVSDAPWCSV